MNEFFDALTLARWQFGLTTLYHFIFVPLTIGLSLLVAILQTVWVRTGKIKYLRLTRLFGKIFLINFAMGVVTGIVGLAGGLGGFLLPLMFGALADLLQIRSSCFMLLYGVVWVSLIIMYIGEVRKVQISGEVTSGP